MRLLSEGAATVACVPSSFDPVRCRDRSVAVAREMHRLSRARFLHRFTAVDRPVALVNRYQGGACDFSPVGKRNFDAALDETHGGDGRESPRTMTMIMI